MSKTTASHAQKRASRPVGSRPSGPRATDVRSVASQLTISQLAKLACVTRDTLLYYDRIGLLVPETRGANHYRYYSERELLKVNLIRTFQSLGMSLKDIRALLEKRDPDSVLTSLHEQIDAIGKERAHLEQMHALLEDYRDIIAYARDLDEGDIVVRWVDEKAILIGPPNDYARGRTLRDNIRDAYRYFQERVTSLETNYPMWSFYEKESVQSRRWRFPDRFYLSNPRGTDTRRAGWYVVGCARGGYGGSPCLFERLLAFIEDRKLEITGRSYVDYLLNEITVSNPDEYLIQVSIEVAGPPARA